MKRAGIFSPYWDSLGGGEKYTAAAVSAYLKSHEVVLFWPDVKLVEKIKKRYDMDLTNTTVDTEGFALLNAPGNFLEKIRLSAQFDDFFWVSDGSVPWLFSKNKLLHFQVPFQMNTSFFTQTKVKLFSHVICNSQFTKKVIDQSFKTKAKVVYPPATMMKPLPKKKLILSVGRFDNTLQSKRHDIMLETFKQARFDGWQLLLTGGVLHGKEDLEALQKASENTPVRVEGNPSFPTLQRWYGEAMFYWHAAGYGADETTEPEKVEHFGISTVEAMSAGAVPIVYAAGGQREIVHHGKNGFLWQTPEELIAYTIELMKSPSRWKVLSQQARITSQQFSMQEFEREFRQYIS